MLDPSAVISVSELTRLARQTLEREFPMLWVGGEISNLTRAASGHIYFSLKDEWSQARCVLFRARAQSVPWRLENGQQVEARVLISLYEPRGDFQLNVDVLRRAGLGRLFEAIARLKARLEAEGLFAAGRKRPLPRFPRRIGIISSPHAAALRDVLAALKRRAPNLGAIIYPTLVQGDRAAAEIAEAVVTAGQRRECDLLLIVRGGGSIEDLWAFNEEVVARAIFASPLPIVSGVGHETDTTIADYVADLRAATPTAAAEMATQGWHLAAGEVAALAQGLSHALENRLADMQQRVDQVSLRLVHPATRLTQSRNRLTLLESQLDASLGRLLRGHRDQVSRAALAIGRLVPRTERRRGELGMLAWRFRSAMREQQQKRLGALAQIGSALTHLNPEATLARGFAIVRDAQGRLITDASTLHPGETIVIDLALGKAEASILTTMPDPTLIAN